MHTENLQIAGMLKPSDKHARLRDARSRSYPTAKEAARALGVPYGTYSGHESGTRGFSNEEAARYARFFHVRADWLIFGGKEPDELRIRPLLGTVGYNGIIEFMHEGAPLRSVLLDSLVGDAGGVYLVDSHHTMPWLRKDTLLVCGYRLPTIKKYTQRHVISSGASFSPRYGIAHSLNETDRLDIECLAEPIMRQVAVDWVEEVCAIIPQGRWGLMPLPATQSE